MAAESKAQQRLMGMAYAVKSGEMSKKDASQEVIKLADSMTLKQLKKYAETKHTNLPDKVDDNLQASDISGMGATQYPTDTKNGSGDVPLTHKKKKRKRIVKTFEQFINM